MSMVSAPEEPDVQIPVAELETALERGASNLHLTVGANTTPERDLVRRDDHPIMTPYIDMSNRITMYSQPVPVPLPGTISRSGPTIVQVGEIA